MRSVLLVSGILLAVCAFVYWFQKSSVFFESVLQVFFFYAEFLHGLLLSVFHLPPAQLVSECMMSQAEPCSWSDAVVRAQSDD